MLRWVVSALLVLPLVASVQVPAQGLEPRPSIDIVGDDGFASPLSGVRGGSGTAEDPYVISDWLIVATGGSGIQLRDTTAHMVIENVVIDAAHTLATFLPPCFGPDLPVATCSNRAGIALQNASNVVIREVAAWVDTFPMSAAVWIQESSNVDVSRVVVGFERLRPTVPFVGVLAFDSRDVVVREMDSDFDKDQTVMGIGLTGGWSPVWASRVEGLAVRDSRFLSSGISVGSSTDVDIENNVFVDAGVRLSGTSARVRVANNVFEDGRALDTHAWGDERIVSVLFCGNVVRGGPTESWASTISLTGARGAAVVGNRISGSRVGLSVGSSEGVEVRSNTFASSGEAAARFFSPAVLRDNAFEAPGDSVRFLAGGDARENWWGDPSGPSGLGPGTGAKLEGEGVAFDPWLTSPPGSDVDCASVPLPGPPGPRPDPIVESHSFDGAVAARLVVNVPEAARVTVSARYEIAPTTAVEFALFVQETPPGAAQSAWSAFAGIGRTVHADASARVADSMVSVVTPPALGWFEGAFGVTSTYCCVAPGGFTWRMVGGEAGGVVRTHYDVRVEAASADIVWDFSERTDLVTSQDFGASRGEAEIVLAGAAVSSGSEASVGVEHRLVGYSLYERGVVDVSEFTLEGPDGTTRDAKHLPLLGEPAGLYRVRMDQVSAGTPGIPMFLYADLP